MKCEILEKKNNPLLKREELQIKIENNVCPKRDDLIKELNLNENCSVVKKIYSFFGEKNFKAEIFVYQTKEDKNKIEKIPRKTRKKMLEESKKQSEVNK